MADAAPNIPAPSTAASETAASAAAALRELQQVLDREIPMCRQMDLRVELPTGSGREAGSTLSVSMPLDGNHNHQQTAFAGSLNALCTIAGWGATYLALGRVNGEGAIVIRRSQIKYHRPVDTPRVVARCVQPTPEQLAYFGEMLTEKGQAKFDLTVEIASTVPTDDRPAVVFSGSYVVLPPGTSVAADGSVVS